MAYADPTGMSAAEKQRIHAGYDQLNARIRRGALYGGLVDQLTSAKQPSDLMGIQFEFSRIEQILQSRIVFSRSGRQTKRPPGFLVDLIGSRGAELELDATLPAHAGFRATETFCSMMRIVAGKTLTFDALCRRLADHFEADGNMEAHALRFIERCAVHGVFERCNLEAT